jgi:F-type H+-transporting ATPase subunit gamma
MAKTREIKKRIKAVGNIRRITKTMQMIATAKFSAAQSRSVASKPYTETIFDLVAQIASNAGEQSHPLLASGDQGSKASGKSASADLTLILTSDRGLCGPYNGSVLRRAMHLIRENAAVKAGQIELVGKKGAGMLKFNGIKVSQQHTFGDKPAYEQVRALAEEFIAKYSSGEVGRVRVVYMRYVSAGKQVPDVLQLLPFDPAAAKAVSHASQKSGEGAGDGASKASINYEFSPDAMGILDQLLPAAVKAVLFQCFNDAVVSEHVARMIAMKAATDNAGKMGKALTRKFNRARQAQITTELTEIISGAAALE